MTILGHFISNMVSHLIFYYSLIEQEFFEKETQELSEELKKFFVNLTK